MSADTMPEALTKSVIPEKAFSIAHRVYFNETNAMGSVVYFSNYVKWQGIAREAYFVETVEEWPQISRFADERKLNMITVEEHSLFLKHAHFGDELTIHLLTGGVRKFSFKMFFFVCRTSSAELLYEGVQELAFDDCAGKFVEIPPPMLRSIQERMVRKEEIPFSKLAKTYL